MSPVWVVGIALIVASALFSAWTERRASRSRADYLAGLQANTAASEELAAMMEQLPSEPATPLAARPRTLCACGACLAVGLTHTVVTAPPTAPASRGFGVVRTGVA